MCVPPVYIPATGTDNRAVSHDVLITKYFNLGLEYAEILAFLAIYHGIILSIRQLKSILKRNNLRRRKNHSSLNNVIAAIKTKL